MLLRRLRRECLVNTLLSVAPGLSRIQHRRVVENGPELVETEIDYRSLFSQTGRVMTEWQDATEDYVNSFYRQRLAESTHQEALIALIGAGECVEGVEGWGSKRDASGDKLLRRELFVAVPAGIQ